jgi:hypothetical protein
VGHRVPCSHRCIIVGCRAFIGTNIIGKSDQPIVYASKLLNNAEQNYNTIEKEALAMVVALHKFRHYLLINKFLFYVNHMALVYLVNKPHVSKRTIRWLLLFLECDFTILYKLIKTSYSCRCRCFV